jgi:hypothetical protein
MICEKVSAPHVNVTHVEDARRWLHVEWISTKRSELRKKNDEFWNISPGSGVPAWRKDLTTFPLSVTDSKPLNSGGLDVVMGALYPSTPQTFTLMRHKITPSVR